MRIIINTYLLPPRTLCIGGRCRGGSGVGEGRAAPTLRRSAGGLWRAVGVGLWLLSAAACSTVPSLSGSSREQACLDFYRSVEQSVADAGVRDGGAQTVPGYPYLRVDRFLAAYREQLTDSVAYRSWLEAAADMDLRARRLELANLPPASRMELAKQGRQSPEQRLARCSRLLRRQPAFHSEQRPRMLQAASVPDHYLTWQRALGLYPLAEPFARVAIERLHQRLQRPFLEPVPLPGRLLIYRPQQGEALALLSARLHGTRVERDALGVPRLPDDMLAGLFARFAPVLEVDTGSYADRIGRIHLSEDGQAVVNTADPTVYRFTSFTRFHDEALLQLNYLFWFPARDTGDIYAGHLDALIWRVTLDPRFQPLAYDSIHGCGCYYHLFPAPEYRLLDPADGTEPVLSPLAAPALRPSQRIGLRLAAGTHYLQGIRPVTDSPLRGISYSAVDYDRLRSLPLADGGHRSLFAENGLVVGSERPERFLFWPFGVRSAGAMRQPGTHAIAFVGRRHFDDPYLLQQLLEKAP